MISALLSRTMMQIGDYPFSIDTAAYDSMERSATWRWSAQDRLGRMPARQYNGPDSDTISLSGMILPAWRGGTGQIDDMRAEANKGTPLILVDGKGYIWGRYVIESIKETQTLFTSNGVGRKVMFDMSLSQYGDDAASVKSDQAAASVFRLI
jgi:uncharacterized protein